MTRGSWCVSWIGKREDEHAATLQRDYFDDEGAAKAYAEDVGGVWFFETESTGPWTEEVA